MNPVHFGRGVKHLSFCLSMLRIFIFVHKIEKDGIPISNISTLWEEKAYTTSIVDYNLKIKE